MKKLQQRACDMRTGGKFVRIACAVSALACAAVLTACADMKGIEPTATLHEPDSLDLPMATQITGPDVKFSEHEPFAAIDWWKAFGDEQLNRLVNQALSENPNLRAAAARVVKAQSAIGIASAAEAPQLNGQLDAQRMQFQKNYIYPPPLGGNRVSMGTLQLNGSWEVDFFGKNSGALTFAIGQERVAEAQQGAARVLLAANVARTYLQWARIEEQRQVAQRTLEQRQEMLRLVRARLDAGLDTQMELRQNESGRADSRAQITALEQQAEITKNALAALLGQPKLPSDVTTPRMSGLNKLTLPVTISADWLGRRPDIVAARWRVEATKGNVEVAKSQFYPNINLVAAIGLQSLGFNNWLKAGSLEWSTGPAIRLPIFEGGKLRANLRGQTADLDASIEDYNATVIDAIRDAADQVQTVKSLDVQRVQQGQSLVAAEGAYSIARDRYRVGLGTYLNVLFAEGAVLVQRRLVTDLQAQSLLAQVGLAQAMGGGWEPVPVPGAKRKVAVQNASQETFGIQSNANAQADATRRN
jgi:NodT family efflux transporter outer membrane factor (OMF) lipoprotein